MAYTVGSASVDIVPDFRNAQLAITAFFAKQQNELKIPVKLDTDGGAGQALERQAKQLGTRTGNAMNEGMKLSQAAADRLAIQQAKARERAILQAHAEAHRMNDRMNREAEKAAKALLDSEAKARIEAEREVIRAAQGEARVRNQAHAEALRMQAEMDRSQERSARAAEAAAQRELKAVERALAERARLQEQELRERSRTEERYLREEESRFRKSAAAISKSYNNIFRDRAREKIRIEIDERQALMEGRKAGGLITRATKEEIRQNAGLISLVLGGVLLAGAPLALGAASALFMGIGAISAAQSQRVRTAWIGTWDQIKSGAIADGQALVPVFERSATAIAQSFQRMRPLIRDAFTSIEPQIDSFVGRVTQAAENTLPGLVQAVQASGPAVVGLGQLLEKTGTGLSNFFTTLSTHAPAAGEVASNLGDALAALLPTLAELLGQGAQLGTIVLPLVTTAFDTLHSVVSALGGTMPSIAAGFLAFRAVQGTGRIITGWGQSLKKASEEGGRFSNMQSKLGTAMAKVGPAFVGAGLVIAAYGAMLAKQEQQVDSFTQIVLKGGDAAAALKTKIEGLPNTKAGDFLREQYEKAEKGARAYLASLTPLERAQYDVDVASRNLANGLGDETTTSAELARLKGEVARAAARQASEEDKLAVATRGVTEAMQEQADAARARVDASFGYQQAVLDVADAQQKYKDTLADTEASALDVEQALLDVNKAYSDQVAAAGLLATSNLPASMNDQQKAIIGARAELEEMNKLIAQGVVLPPSMEAYRQQLISITGGADQAKLAQDTLAAALGEVGVAVEGIPDTASVKIDAPTQPVIDKLLELGFTVETLPGGEVKVTADTDLAKSNLGNLSGLLAALDTTTATPTANLNQGPFTNIFNAVMTKARQLAGTEPTPKANMNPTAFNNVYKSIMGSIAAVAGQRPNPTVSINNQASGPLTTIARQINALPTNKTIHVNTNYTTTGSSIRSTVGPKLGGAIENGVIAPYRKFGFGGAIVGRGGTMDDLIPALGPEGMPNYRVSNGEHILDGRDVVLMGGQAGVYAFREMLNAGKFGNFSSGTGVRQMLSSGPSNRPAASQGSAAPRHVSIHTSDNPRAIIRAMRADEHQAAALAPVWG